MLIYGYNAGLKDIDFALYKDNYEVNWEFQVLEKTNKTDENLFLVHCSVFGEYFTLDRQQIDSLLQDPRVNLKHPIFSVLQSKLKEHEFKWKDTKDNFYLILDLKEQPIV